MVWTYKTKPDNEVMPWPTWVACITNVSHFLLTFVCSANFFIYYAKHGSLCKSRKAKKRNDLASPTHTQAQSHNLGSHTRLNSGVTVVEPDQRSNLLRIHSRNSR